VDGAKSWGRRYNMPTTRHNKPGSCVAMVPRVCPFSVMLCNFEVASQMLKFRLALTDEKQRERTETTWARMASGLHMWSQSPPHHILASVGAEDRTGLKPAIRAGLCPLIW